MNVGLCWQGSRTHRNDKVRSIPVTALGPLAAVDGVQWVAMCRDEWKPQMAQAGWVNGLEGCRDWYDTAQAVRQLDLLITVDTAIAHVAGGLGVPVWILLAAIPDMRWMLDRPDTPWYQSARLYRQQVVGDWTPVLEQVAADLNAMTMQGAA